MDKCKKVILFVWPCLAYSLFALNIIPTTFSKMGQFMIIALTIFYIFPDFVRRAKVGTYSYYVRMIFLSVILSMVMSYLFWGQSLVLSFRISCMMLSVVYFFLLKKWGPEEDFLKKIIIFYAIINIIIWLAALAVAPLPLIGSSDEELDNTERGIYRVFVNGYGFFILLYFYILIKARQTKKNILYILLALMFSIIVLHAVRQVIAIVLLLTLFFIFKTNIKVIIIFGAMFIALYFILPKLSFSEDSVIGSLVQLSEEQYESHKSGNDDVRLREYVYFFTEVPNSIGTVLFGNGMPHSEGTFGRWVERAMHGLGYFYTDVGYAALFFQLGIFGLFVYIKLFYKIIKSRVEVDTYYAKLFLLYMIISNVTSYPILSEMIPFTVCIYLIEKKEFESRTESLLQHY